MANKATIVYLKGRVFVSRLNVELKLKECTMTQRELPWNKE